jgi:uncharacterized protein
MKENTRKVANLIREIVHTLDPMAEIILYGSRARGDEKSYSDWDILIITDGFVDLNIENKFRDKLYDLELEIGEPLSVFVYSKNDWQKKQRITPFYQNVTEEGIYL